MRYPYALRLLIKGYGGYKWQIVALGLLGFISALAEGIGITALIPLFSRMVGVGISEDVGSKIVGNALGWFGFGLGFKALLSFVALAFLLKSLTLLFSHYVAAKIAFGYEKNIRGDLMQDAFASRWPFLIGQKLGYLETILMKDAEISRKLLTSLGGMVRDGASLLVYIIIALNVSGSITMLSLIIGGILLFAAKNFFYRVKEFSKNAAEAYSDMTHHVGENMVGMKTVKASAVEAKIIRRADIFFDVLKKMQTRLTIMKVVPAVFTEPVSVIFVLSIFAFSYIAGNFQIGVFAATMYLIHRIFISIQNVQGIFYKINEQVPYLERVITLREKMACNREQTEGREPFRFEGFLEFCDVSFSYNEHKEVLASLHFSIKKGDMVGIVGKSGSGKTTIVDLLLRLLTPSGGKILIDGLDISRIDVKDWRRNIGYVSQEIFVMNDTIANNIRFYDDLISDADMKRAAEMAHIYKFIETLPQRFETKVGERGIMLSGGERQRLILARVLLRQPKILVLDEATSALDNESEALIQSAIESLKGKMTALVIAHRLTTLLECDRIMFLENGCIKEEGGPQELLENRDSSFYKLYNIRNHRIEG